MTEQGLFWVDPQDEKPDPFLANAFEGLAQTRDARGSDWGLLLRWRDPDGRMHEWAMPREVLGGRGDELWRNLLRDGLTIASSTASRNKLADYLGSVQAEARARSVTRIGWHASASGQVFVLPDATFGEAVGERVLWQTETRNETFFNVSGSLEDWREEVARRCIGNSRLVMAGSMSFAPHCSSPRTRRAAGFISWARVERARPLCFRLPVASGAAAGSRASSAHGARHRMA